MKCYQIKANDAGQRLDRFVQKVAPRLPVSMLQRSIRIKRIKVNGHRAQNNQMLTIGDVVELYLNDEFFMPDEASPLGFLAAGQELDILYEDENLMLVNKHPGLVVHEDDAGERDTLIARILRHLYEAGQYNPCDENSFSPALCNRIDRNTSGIVIAAKNAQTLRVVNALLRERLIHKYYLCLTHGNLTPPDGLLKGYLVKDAEANRVQVLDAPAPGAKTALTSYHTLQFNGRYSLVEIELHTGRTHQIRAQMAHAGHPLLGDAKYGLARDNRDSGYRFQALCAWRLRFDAGDSAEHLEYLNGRLFEVPQVWFVKDLKDGTLQ